MNVKPFKASKSEEKTLNQVSEGMASHADSGLQVQYNSDLMCYLLNKQKDYISAETHIAWMQGFSDTNHCDLTIPKRKVCYGIREKEKEITIGNYQ